MSQISRERPHFEQNLVGWFTIHQSPHWLVSQIEEMISRSNKIEIFPARVLLGSADMEKYMYCMLIS